MSSPVGSVPQTDHLEQARALVGRIGGFNGNGAEELSLPAIASALIAVAERLDALMVAVGRLDGGSGGSRA